MVFNIIREFFIVRFLNKKEAIENFLILYRKILKLENKRVLTYCNLHEKIFNFTIIIPLIIW